MEYFFSHIGIIFIAALLVAVCAVVWWLLTERNARLIRQRAEARRKAVEAANSQNPDPDRGHNK